MMIAEKNIKKIQEFFDLTNEDYKLRKFKLPVLVYEVTADKVRYSLWENDLLEKFGVENVDGWDKTEELVFCPDWIQGDDDFDDEDDDF
ncbi:MAG: hypothetical protein HN952_02350 [Candidatus Cloacimonetes bacterium]|jgi:hypothetical protein|nr:hypothetical protein [Candidatus Cloacimonadota bacterium]MBT6993773.1 hypothetical protein [Candidatus Cloacimonadota bacterium]MBT7468955.1 hypothetical protein [Candidatus Cloacimonadota bacterium]